MQVGSTNARKSECLTVRAGELSQNMPSTTIATSISLPHIKQYTTTVPRFSRNRTRKHAVVSHAGGKRNFQRQLLHAVPLFVAAPYNGGHLH